jgi:hypothetical protein
MATLPTYDELPIRPGLPAGSSWGVWGDDDVHGCLNLLTPERVLAGVACVQTGERFPLDLPLQLPDPPLFGRPPLGHTVNVLGNPAHPTGHDDQLDGFNTQSSSQWDGFLHILHPTHGAYNGLPLEAHGTHHWAQRGLAGRAVVVDLTRVLEIDAATNQAVPASAIHDALDAQGTTVELGDLLLLRFGWTTYYRGLDEAGRARASTDLLAPGLAPGRATAKVLWDLHVAAVAADVPALEVWPPGSTLTAEKIDQIKDDPEQALERFVHFSLLPLLGLPIGELWDLDALAAACAADGRWTCLFTSSPLNVRGGVASPPNAMALR